MTTTGYTLDTNIIRPLLKKEEQVVARVTWALRRGRSVTVNALSYYETRRGLIAAGANRQLERFDHLCSKLGVLMLDRDILDKAAEIYAILREQGKLIEDADLLMAATALVNNLSLVTHNTAHFVRVPGLEVEDWLAPAEDSPPPLENG